MERKEFLEKVLVERDLGSVDGSHFPKNSVQKNHTFRGVFLESIIKF